MKQCSKCKELKDFTEFAIDKQKKDGLCSSCKVCKKIYDTKYIEKNKDKKYASNLKYNELHRSEKREYDRLRREKYRDIINAKKREYYNSEAGREKHKIWQNENQAKLAASKKNTKHKRREIIKTSTLSGLDLNIWIDQQDKICSYCNSICYNSFHVDHIVPLSKGGKHELSNLTISCPSCNTSKGNKSIEEWNAAKKHTEELNKTNGRVGANFVNPSMIGM